MSASEGALPGPCPHCGFDPINTTAPTTTSAEFRIGDKMPQPRPPAGGGWLLRDTHVVSFTKHRLPAVLLIWTWQR
jgi:hypothetical protein